MSYPISKKKYQSWAETCPSLPIFHQPWYLTAVAGRDWEVALSLDGNGLVRGALPYVKRQHWGLPTYDMPPMTPYLGPWINLPLDLKPVAKQKWTAEVLADLAGQVPKSLRFQQKWHPDAPVCMAFKQVGFQTLVDFTYRLDLGQSADQIWETFSPELRNNIRQAREKLHLQQSDDFENFFQLHEATLKRKDLKAARNVFQNLDQTLDAQQARHIYLAKDADTGEPQAAIYLVFDQKCMYYLASGRLAHAHAGAVAALLWQAIQEACGRFAFFDFEGSYLPAVEKFFRQFGGEMWPAWVVRRYF
jgi:Acetyltransferase (GNAT) domain